MTSFLNAEGKEPCLDTLLLSALNAKPQVSVEALSSQLLVSREQLLSLLGEVPSWSGIWKLDTQQAFPSKGFGRRLLREEQQDVGGQGKCEL